MLYEYLQEDQNMWMSISHDYTLNLFYNTIDMCQNTIKYNAKIIHNYLSCLAIVKPFKTWN